MRSNKSIEEVVLLPLSPLIPDFPALNSITAPENWHKGKKKC